MKCPVGFLKRCHVDLCIELRAPQIRMAQQQLQIAEISAAFQHVGCERVSQGMSSHSPQTGAMGSVPKSSSDRFTSQMPQQYRALSFPARNQSLELALRLLESQAQPRPKVYTPSSPRALSIAVVVPISKPALTALVNTPKLMPMLCKEERSRCSPR